MPRIRQIKPEFFLDDELAECSRDARLLFLGLWPIADREGRLENRPAKIKAQVFPYDSDMSFQKVSALLEQLIKHRFILVYTVNGRNYIQIRSFTKHQHCHVKEPESMIPPMPEEPYLPGTRTVQSDKTGSSTVQEPSKPGGFLSMDNGEMENGETAVPGKSGVCGLNEAEQLDLFGLFWEWYPRKESKQRAWEEFQKAHPSKETVLQWKNWLDLAEKSEQWSDKSKIPHPSTWLHQRRWESDPPPPPVCRSGTSQTRSEELSRVLNNPRWETNHEPGKVAAKSGGGG